MRYKGLGVWQRLGMGAKGGRGGRVLEWLGVSGRDKVSGGVWQRQGIGGVSGSDKVSRRARCAGLLRSLRIASVCCVRLLRWRAMG